MRTKPHDWTIFEQVISSFESRLRHRREHPREKSDELFYGFWVKYLRNIRTAKDQGKYLVYHNTNVPTEILYAMDLVPVHLQVSLGMAAVAAVHEKCLNSPFSLGLTPETCSLCRYPIGFFLEGIFPPPDIFVGNHAVCDMIVNNGDLIGSLCGCPQFTFEKPYNFSDDAIWYIVEQLQEMIHFLEEQTQRKLDWGRLEETVDYALQMERLHRGISELRKHVPTPLRSRKGPELQLADFYFCGTPTGVEYYHCVLDECKEKVEKGGGAITNENFRLLSPYYFPTYGWELVDWSEKVWGAINVMEIMFSHWGEVDFDPQTPLETIAKRFYEHPITRYQNCSLDMLTRDIVKEAREYRADALVWWAHRSCSQMLSSIWAMDNAIRENVGIPILQIDEDYTDPAIVPISLMRDKLNAFFEMLDTQKNI